MQDERELDEQYPGFFQDIPIGLYVTTATGEVKHVNGDVPSARALLAICTTR
jgi:hypothetical protein